MQILSAKELYDGFWGAARLLLWVSFCVWCSCVLMRTAYWVVFELKISEGEIKCQYTVPLEKSPNSQDTP